MVMAVPGCSPEDSVQHTDTRRPRHQSKKCCRNPKFSLSDGTKSDPDDSEVTFAADTAKTLHRVQNYLDARPTTPKVARFDPASIQYPLKTRTIAPPSEPRADRSWEKFNVSAVYWRRGKDLNPRSHKGTRDFESTGYADRDRKLPLKVNRINDFWQSTFRCLSDAVPAQNPHSLLRVVA